MTTTTTTESKKRTITLTDARPVTIREELWPVIAHASYDWHDGEVRCQANRTVGARIRVRRHADGRAIVYGTYTRSSNFRHDDEEGSGRAGRRLDATATEDDVIAAIRRVTADLAETAWRAERDRREILALAAECIADLPPTDLE